ncbi:MAG: hypothetical protein H7177_03885, partial [Rhizobacter sp.]|nr:hypothetical protein [Bacteriovorax sp.]
YEKLTGGKVNYAKEQANFLNKMNGAVKKALQSKGMTATGMMASMGTSGISGAGKVDAVPELSKKPAATAGVVDIGTQSGAGTEKDKSLNLDFKDASGANLAAVDMSGGTQTKAPEYEIDSNEINGKNGPSLFEVISGRYIKSGYPKLLEEEPVKN